MELSIAFFVTGIAVLAFTIWRIYRFRIYSNFVSNLCDTYQCNDIDLSGNTLYTDCISHTWTLNNIIRKKHSRLGNRFQDLMFHDTFITTIWFSLILGIGVLIFGAVVVYSIQIAGILLVIFIIGAFASLGSGEVKISEDLLSTLYCHKIEDLSTQDYTYASIALGSIKKWISISIIVGSSMVVFSPWGELAPTVVGWIVSIITVYMIWYPTIFLAEFSAPIAVLYLIAAWPALILALIFGIRKVRKSNVEMVEPTLQV
ncbi:MAG: hypothetical protein AM325_005190 [Candidatus Thorarchaeota archaeon SMTZ1-45]|nr:MAG: hypothetical protein AM325_06955 [Candidatus Thorarchaeota archaeon SMTZ1-45]